MLFVAVQMHPSIAATAAHPDVAGFLVNLPGMADGG